MSPSRLEDPLPDKPVGGFPKHLAEDSKAAKVDSFDGRTVTVADVVESLIRTGGCIVRNLVSKEDVAAIDADVRPYILKDQPWQGDFFPPETRRVTGLEEKSPTFTRKVLGNELYQDVCTRLLSSTHEAWLGQKLETSVSPPQVNNTIVFFIIFVVKLLDLHRDDMNYHNELPHLNCHTEYKTVVPESLSPVRRPQKPMVPPASFLEATYGRRLSLPMRTSATLQSSSPVMHSSC